MLCALMMVGVVYAGARDQDLKVLRLQDSQAQYAAEAGANMALKEIFDNLDEDGDGAVGTISNDGNVATDPTVNGAQVTVIPAAASTGVKYNVKSRIGNVQRTIELWLRTPGGIEGFEAYAVGVALNNIGGWAPWDDYAGAVAYATNARARTGAMCVDIEQPSDNIH